MRLIRADRVPVGSKGEAELNRFLKQRAAPLSGIDDRVGPERIIRYTVELRNIRAWRGGLASTLEVERSENHPRYELID